MKNKKLWSVLLIAVLAFALGLGSMAYYTRTFTSDNNTIATAKFKVSSNGTLDGNAKFQIGGESIYPGVKLDAYSFEIDKKGTQVPMEYTISLSLDGEAFEDKKGNPSPLKVSVLREKEDGWEDIGGLEKVKIEPEKEVEKFKVHISWPHNDEIDADFEDLGGIININVIAKQIDGEGGGGEDPDPDPNPGAKLVKAELVEFPFLKNFGNVRIEVKDIDRAAKFRVKYFLNDAHDGKIPDWTEIFNIDEETSVIFYMPEDRLTIEIYAEDGEELLHTFTNVKLTIVE